MRSGFAMDLGSVNTLVHVLGQGLLLEGAFAHARRRPAGEVVAVRQSADRLTGREPVDIEVAHPLHEGVIPDLDAATRLLYDFLARLRFHTSALRPRSIMCVTSAATPFEREAPW